MSAINECEVMELQMEDAVIAREWEVLMLYAYTALCLDPQWAGAKKYFWMALHGIRLSGSREGNILQTSLWCLIYYRRSEKASIRKQQNRGFYSSFPKFIV